MRGRTPAEELGRDAAEALGRALARLGLKVEGRNVSGENADVAFVTSDGRRFSIDVKAMAVPSADRVGALARSRTENTLTVLVADQLSVHLRESLNEAGVSWFDRRGHLRLVANGLFIDSDVPPEMRFDRTARDARRPINGRSGLAAACGLLLRPDDPLGVSDLARVAHLNASSITRAMSTLVDAHLAERRGRGEYHPLVPELFWALADVWPRDSVIIQWSAASDFKQLLAAQRDLSRPGWAEAGVRAAISWGAPLVATADFPRHWYVPDEPEVRRLATVHANGGGEVWTLSADPIGLIANDRYVISASGQPFAHPLFCALDLTSSARDREALDQWTPPKEFTRVW